VTVGVENGLATPVADVEFGRKLERGRRGVRLNIRGRTLTLRGLNAPRSGIVALLSVLGPGLIAATAGDDAGGIATYTQTGAKFGYDLLWVLLIVTVTLAVIQEMAARLGAVTGRGLLDLVREEFGIGRALLMVIVVLVANGGVIVTEFAGIAAAAELFGLSRYIAVPLCAIVLWYSVSRGTYAAVEKVFLLMTVAFLAYPVSVVIGHPDWGGVAHGLFVPTLSNDSEYLTMLVALIGTTVTPYMQLFQQSSVVEKGVARRHYGEERTDAYLGAIVSNIIAACIVIAAATTLRVAGITDVQTAQDAAAALEPAAGKASQALFAVGLFGASILAAGVLPLATAYSVSEAFGFRKGVNLDFRRAPFFLSIFSVLIAVGAVVALLPGIPLFQLLIGIQVLNGILLPITMVFILLLINNRRLVGDMRNGLANNVIGWGSLVLVTAAAGALLLNQFLGFLG
jgi:NRAMP (natural resistance-associated macrophage protein)-like metal ion transporter